VPFVIRKALRASLSLAYCAPDTQPDPECTARTTSGTTQGKKNPAELNAAAGLKREFRIGRPKVRSQKAGDAKDDLLRASAPIVDFLLRLVLSIAVLGLKLTLELFPVSIDLRELIVSELAPLLFHLAGKLLPVSLTVSQFMVGLLLVTTDCKYST